MRLHCTPFAPSLTVFPSVALIITVVMNVVMTVTVMAVITAIGIVGSALPVIANARTPHHPAVTLMTADQGPPAQGVRGPPVNWLGQKGGSPCPTKKGHQTEWTEFNLSTPSCEG